MTVTSGTSLSYATDSCGSTGTLSSPSECTYIAQGEDTFTVPAGVTTVDIDAISEAGGEAEGAAADDATGFATEITADLPVTSGSTEYVEVGVGGGSGLGGGGDGGGLSGIYSCSGEGSTAACAQVSAGGGGGNGYEVSEGGYGGGFAGADEPSCVPGNGALGDGVFGGGGGGGQCDGGGTGGAYSSCPDNDQSQTGGNPGSAGLGGSGGESGGGGGGAGYYGGGGGGGGGGQCDSSGGGGGSSFVEANATDVEMYGGPVPGDDGIPSPPSVTISWGTATSGPTATIDLPASDQIFAVDQSVATDFNCDESESGAPITSCLDNYDSTSPDTLDTSTPGNFTYTVTAKDANGEIGTTSITYSVALPPTVSISSPATGGDYETGESVATAFDCADGDYGPGIATCVDDNGGSGDAGSLKTSTPGCFTYTVTATSDDGQTATASISYSVDDVGCSGGEPVGSPTATIESPSDNQTYKVGQSAPTSFSCAEGEGGPGLASCTDSNGASGGTGSLTTSTTGSFTYTVTAKSKDGDEGTDSISYDVIPTPAPKVIFTSPGRGQTFTLGQSVKVSYQCADSGGPGISSCVGCPTSTASTSSFGTHVCKVTATSKDGETGSGSLTYYVKRVQKRLTITKSSGVVGTPLTLKSTGGSGPGKVSYVVAGGSSGCVVSGALVHAKRSGTCVVTATKAGDAAYEAISSKPATIEFS